MQHAKERLSSAREWTKQEAEEFAERAAERVSHQDCEQRSVTMWSRSQ